MTTNSSNLVLLCLAVLISPLERSVQAQQSPTLFDSFVASQSTGAETALPDYSYAGYHRCEKPVPEVTPETHRYFDVTEYGATPNDRLSDRDGLLAALAAAHAHSGPAVVYFPRGMYLLNEASDLGKPPLEITRSGIVVKGDGVAKTQLRFSEAPFFEQPFILIRSSSGVPNDYWRGEKRLKGKIVEQLDTFRVRVSDAAGIKPGMRINLNATLDINQATTADYFKPHDIPQGVLGASNGKIRQIFELHVVRKVDENVLTFAEPIHLKISYFTNIYLMAVENCVEECGVEDLTLTGNYRMQFKHHNGSRKGEDFRMIGLDRAFNCWARRLRVTDYSQAIGTWLTGFNTFSDILLEGNAGHQSVSVGSSYGNLFAYVRENTDTHHGLGVALSACNTVFLRCNQYANMEAHCAFPRSTLYDCNEGRFTPRGGGAKFFPHHDKGLTFWNWKVTEPGSYDFWPDGKPYGSFMPPIIAGLHGANFEVKDVALDILAFESRGRPTNPASLFEAQLALRLGKLPTWLEEASQKFESISRHSQIQIEVPKDHARVGIKSTVAVRMSVPDDLDPKDIVRVDLLASSSSLRGGFRRLRKADPKSLSTSFRPPQPGVWVLRALLTNSRGEISATPPVTIYAGNEARSRQRKVVQWTMVPGDTKVKAYQEFVKQGGGEAPQLPQSKVLAKRSKNEPWYRFEKDYSSELQQFYADFSQRVMKPIVEDQKNIEAASPLFDNDLNTTADSLYTSHDMLVQARFAQPVMVNRLDIHWKNKVANKPIRLELQTAIDFPACWTSVVNDEPLWEPSVARLGGTLRKYQLHERHKVTRIYFPARKTEAVRLLLVSFPNNAVSELKFYGEDYELANKATR